MTAYALAHLRHTTVHEDVLDYIERIQATLVPYAGRFLVHGPDVHVMEGAWPGTLVVIEFPDLATARSWYASPAYQEILPLRTSHVAADAIVFEGVPADYDPAVKARELRRLATSAG